MSRTPSQVDDPKRPYRLCTTCGKPLQRGIPYLMWLFHTCRGCAAEPAPDRWGDGRTVAGTYRKWRYFPRWHLTKHPDLPEQKRERFRSKEKLTAYE